MQCAPAFRVLARAPLVLLLAVGGGTYGCGGSAPTPPEPPDLTSIVDSYANPSARFEEQEIEAVGLAVQGLAVNLAAAGIQGELDQLLDAILEAELEADSEGTLQAGGFVRLTRVCPGWGPTPVADREGNGFQDATGRFTEAGIEPVVWGDLHRCRYLLAQSRIELDAIEGAAFSVAIQLDTGPAEAPVSNQQLLFVLRLAARIDGMDVELSTDFRAVPDGIEYRLEQEDGSLIARVGSNDSLLIRADNGNFLCDGLVCREEGRAP